MSDIFLFEVPQAYAHTDTVGGKRHMIVQLYYPINPKPIDKRLPPDPAYGASIFDQLLSTGYAQIADADHPIKPASAGSLYVMRDGKIICHRRDKGTPTHALYHSAYAGYTSSDEFTHSEEGLRQTGLRESAEECLLVTRESPGVRPWLVVPNDSRDYTLASARRLGLDLRPRYVDVDVAEPTDVLEVYDEKGTPIFTARAFLEWIRESQSSLNALWIRQFPLSSEEVVPVDAEGNPKPDGTFSHFNRESYVLDPHTLGPFGSILKNPIVYQTKRPIVNGVPEMYTPEYREPFLGPDKVEVTDPHVFGPEDLLCRTLDALGVPGYENQWVVIQRNKECAIRDRRSLLPDDVLKK